MLQLTLTTDVTRRTSKTLSAAGLLVFTYVYIIYLFCFVVKTITNDPPDEGIGVPNGVLLVFNLIDVT